VDSPRCITRTIGMFLSRWPNRLSVPALREVMSGLVACLLAAALSTIACGGAPKANMKTTRELPSARYEMATPIETAQRSASPMAAQVAGLGGEPRGLPVLPNTPVGTVVQVGGARRVSWAEGPTAGDYALRGYPSRDGVLANRSGWNCRTHVEYEGQPAIDFYLRPGTPVRATMTGVASLFAVTTSNAFDVYGRNREPYLGDPDRSRASSAPFPGPTGGKGVFVVVANEGFITEYGHLDLAQTLAAVPVEGFLDGYPRENISDEFGSIRASKDAEKIAVWQVERDAVIGYSGDSGYSEAPHLHYTVRRRGSDTLLCPSSEEGFTDGGWLVRQR